MIENKKIIFTEHALLQIKQRKITQAMVLRCIKSPDAIIHQLGQRYRALQITSRGRKHYLLVTVYDRQPNTLLVITAFLTSKVKKYL